MTERDIKRIESALGSALPTEYREFLVEHSDDVSRIKQLLPLRAILWSDAKEIITGNNATRKSAKEMCIGPEHEPWPETFVVVGTNGGGSYWFIDTSGAKVGLWYYEHETCEISRDCKTFDAYLRELHRDEKEPGKWQPEPIRSSFDASCPLLERFGFFISRRCCEIKCQEGDRPLTEKKLRSHGIDIERVGRGVLRLKAALAKCTPGVLTIKRVKKWLIR
jgi:hypothetical protein